MPLRPSPSLQIKPNAAKPSQRQPNRTNASLFLPPSKAFTNPPPQSTSPQTIPFLLRQNSYSTSIQPPCPLFPASLEPPRQILALTRIQQLQTRASFDDGLDADAGDADAATDAKHGQLKEVQADGAERGVGDGGATEGELEGLELWAAER
ncbi:hypothetical protein V493_03202 [Pseudogymnoascus sp. VKM F-4281 (FW-2241)]|nr:hypothetical protein V493_03202 [Pseudogymnoascus sp. VKM F-4281 (FW-2241)]